MCFRYTVGNTLSRSEEQWWCAKWYISLAQLQLMEGWCCNYVHASYLVILYSLIQTAKWLFGGWAEEGSIKKFLHQVQTNSILDALTLFCNRVSTDKHNTQNQTIQGSFCIMFCAETTTSLSPYKQLPLANLLHALMSGTNLKWNNYDPSTQSVTITGPMFYGHYEPLWPLLAIAREVQISLYPISQISTPF